MLEQNKYEQRAIDIVSREHPHTPSCNYVQFCAESTTELGDSRQKIVRWMVRQTARLLEAEELLKMANPYVQRDASTPLKQALDEFFRSQVMSSKKPQVPEPVDLASADLADAERRGWNEAIEAAARICERVSILELPWEPTDMCAEDTCRRNILTLKQGPINGR